MSRATRLLCCVLIGLLASIASAESLRGKGRTTTTTISSAHRDLSALSSSSANTSAVAWEQSEDEQVQRFFAQRRRLVQTLSAGNNKESKAAAWKSLEVVDGLKNEDVAVFVTSTSMRGEIYLWERIIPSARTWMKLFANVFVVVEDNFLVRYALRHCRINEYEHYTTFSCHNEPTYLLSRKCTNEYYGAAGPCCKVDDAFNYLVNDNPELFKHIKYALHADDDTYFRPDQVLRWLAAVDKAGVDDFPIIANANRGRKGDHQGIWHVNEGCKEIQGSGWYQPMMLNHAAMARMSNAVANYGIRDTCKNFDVTHDVGMEAFAWIMSFTHILMPKTEINGGHKGAEILRPTQMVVHNIRHDDKDRCRDGNEKDWPENMRYNQKLAIGCGDIDTPGPFHDKKHLADMYDVWNYFQKPENAGVIEVGKPGVNEFVEVKAVLYQDPASGKEKVKKVLAPNEKPAAEEKVSTVVIPYLTPLEGYSTTKHAKQHDVAKKWVEFKLTDCAIPGKVAH